MSHAMLCWLPSMWHDSGVHMPRSCSSLAFELPSLSYCGRLLAPGEQAFNQQQGIEQEVSQKFGKGKGTNRPRK